MGAGDVKLFAAAGAWLGPMRTLDGALIAAFAGGVLAAVWMLRAYGLAGTAVAASMSVRSPKTVVNHPVDPQSHRAIPYGVALSIGAALAAWFPDMLMRVLNATT
jgi:prepilin peptidase CpaA